MISMIAAMGENHVIGLEGRMPWHLPNDLKFFKRVTSGHAVVMGRKTFVSLGKPLPGRRNIVVTRDRTFSPAGVEVIHSLEKIKDVRDTVEEVFVIGGATLYNEMLPFAEKIYLTIIHEKFAGDTLFPKLNEQEWQVVSTEKGIIDEKNQYEHTFYVYERK
ncbi:dihydrofolate reductase [Evansella caseinilytica]|uniref:Dihydrofolate reductase n=1 Tax=Evansella caseinilytica TaxID=1503961 RepID=A0A1H3UCS9_9BACI|nr:dihydrofolate reductase [Evansella caseinilytica]SDZ60168.1 dihydrofolate reductase [Evansella caseinilytica]